MGKTTVSFCIAKESNMLWKDSHRMGEDIYKSNIQQGVSIKNCEDRKKKKTITMRQKI